MEKTLKEILDQPIVKYWENRPTPISDKVLQIWDINGGNLKLILKEYKIIDISSLELSQFQIHR